MKAMILAAGRGERMRPLTDDCPKPLLEVRGKPLIAYQLEALAASGFREIVINVHHLADRIIEFVGDGAKFGVTAAFSPEVSALETAGGIRKALPLLGAEPFAVISGDVMSDFPYERLRRDIGHADAHLVMVDNPPHHPAGDFALTANGTIEAEGARLTYSGIGIYHPRFFGTLAIGQVVRLRTLMERAIDLGKISGEHYAGFWSDVGTPERLAQLNQNR